MRYIPKSTNSDGTPRHEMYETRTYHDGRVISDLSIRRFVCDCRDSEGTRWAVCGPRDHVTECIAQHEREVINLGGDILVEHL